MWIPAVPRTLHRHVEIDGVRIFYREAGPADASVLLLPHGYPSSSFQFRNFMPALADHWRLIAPDYPGFGYSDTPPRERFAYDFDGYASFLERFASRLGVQRFALYLHDFGSQIGLRLAMGAPDRVAALVIQNGDIYEDQLGPKYEWLKTYWADPTPEGREQMAANVSLEGFRDEFAGDLPPAVAERVPPELWEYHWSLMTPERREHVVGLFEDQAATLEWFPREQAYLREHQPPTLIVWGPHDGYMPEPSARAYLRDLPDAEFHLLDTGHFLLEDQLDVAAPLMHDFLDRHLSGS